MSRWDERDDVARGADYDARWKEMASAGMSVHGEVDLICSLLVGRDLGDTPSMLDAGCGTGRIAIELAGRGIDVVGVDLDAAMLAEARAKAPEQHWIRGDLIDIELGTLFDLVIMAGNVMIFVSPGTEAAVVANVAGHLRPGGQLVAGFQTGGDRLDVDEYDRHAAAAGLTLIDRWSTWERAPFTGGDYAVSVHRLDAPVR